MARLAIIDDDDGLRRALDAFLSSPERTVDTFADGQRFLDALPEMLVDVAVLDLRMPGVNGLKVLEQLQPLRFPVIMMSADGDVRSAVAALKMGALDFIEKPFTPDALEALIDTALKAGTQNGGVLSVAMANGAVEPAASKGQATDPLEVLTPREREVALALNQGFTNKEVARELGCSPRTVEVHRARIFDKLGVGNIAGLVRIVSGLKDQAGRDSIAKS